MKKREEKSSGLSYDEGIEGSQEVEFARLELVPSSGVRFGPGNVRGISMSLSFPNGVSSNVLCGEVNSKNSTGGYCGKPS